MRGRGSSWVLGVGCFHCQQISVPGLIAPPKLRTAKCAWVDSTSKTQGFGVGDRSRKMFLSRSSCAWSRFAHPWIFPPFCSSAPKTDFSFPTWSLLPKIIIFSFLLFRFPRLTLPFLLALLLPEILLFLSYLLFCCLRFYFSFHTWFSVAQDYNFFHLFALPFLTYLLLRCPRFYFFFLFALSFPFLFALPHLKTPTFCFPSSCTRLDATSPPICYTVYKHYTVFAI